MSTPSTHRLIGLLRTLEVVDIAKGQIALSGGEAEPEEEGEELYFVRPLLPKGTSELIYKDAAASIRRTGQEF